ncbi:MAG: DUF4625 domain-containing protein, partial [Bacteroidales bacterium]
MKTRFFLIAIALTAGLFFNSCKKEKEKEVPKPVISALELGNGNSHIAYIGADLHIQAEIVAEGKINKIRVEIHKAQGSGNEIMAEYTEFAGLKNTTFHKHVDIPNTTVAGPYHFHMTVTDMEGNSTTVEEGITILELVDTVPPQINITSAPENGKTFANGDTITISGHVTDNISLAGLFVGLVYEADSIPDPDVTAANPKVIVMLHTHDFGEDPDETDFTASIKVGAAYDNNMTPAPIQGPNAWKSGRYYILVKSKDAKGNGAKSAHYPIVINL